MYLQPWLHDLQIAVDGPATALAAGDGAIGAPGTGWFVDDRRLVSLLDLQLDGRAVTPVACDTVGNVSRFWGVARHLGDPTPDPTVLVTRERTVRGKALTETITVASRATAPVRATLRLCVGGDGAELAAVKGGRADDLPLLPLATTRAPECDEDDGGAAASDAAGPVVAAWADARHRTVVRVEPAPAATAPEALAADGTATGICLGWPLDLDPHERVTVTVTATAHRVTATSFDSRAGSALADFADAGVAGDEEWDRLLRTNLADLRHLLQTDPEGEGDVFAAAGSPWYLTLFGRDSLWAARFLLPFSPALARGTLRTLARRQARAADPETAAEPGKILHEVRREVFEGTDMSLPPVYYGTVDATPLWICLLVDAWRWGLAEADVRELLPTLRAALGWLADTCTASPDGLLRYLDTSGHGLTNQGWKDSGDSMRRADGSIAEAPIALVEAQGYAVEAALGAAELLDALGEDGGARWRAFAEGLAGRIRDRFWVGRGKDAYLAMALDGAGRPVDGVGSNMGHLLGTGALTAKEEKRVVARLMRPDMLRRFGIATLSAENPAYNPIGYHTGSVWTHDTAVIARSMQAAGFGEEAREVVRALRRLSAAMDHRFPELISGDPVGTRPVPYPASCRPQAWAAASAAVMVCVAAGVSLGDDGKVRSGADTTGGGMLGPGWELHGVRAAGRAATIRG